MIGERIRLAREGKGLSLQDVAEAWGVNKSFVGAIEAGDKSVPLDRSFRLAEILGVPVDQLVPADRLPPLHLRAFAALESVPVEDRERIVQAIESMVAAIRRR